MKSTIITSVIERAAEVAEIILQVDENLRLNPEEKRAILEDIFDSWTEIYSKAQDAMRDSIPSNNKFAWENLKDWGHWPLLGTTSTQHH